MSISSDDWVFLHRCGVAPITEEIATQPDPTPMVPQAAWNAVSDEKDAWADRAFRAENRVSWLLGIVVGMVILLVSDIWRRGW